MKPVALMVVAIALSAGTVASAQTRQTTPTPRPPLTERVFISVNGLFQGGSNDFSVSQTIRENAENGTFNTSYAVGSGPGFDVSGGVLVWRNLVVGVGVTRFSESTTTAITASVPHPFFFNQPRSVTGEFSGTREELAVHVQLRGVFAINRRIQVAVFGGPSFFQIDQSIVDDFEYTESYPFDTAAYSRAVSSTQSESAVGINVGGDVGYFFTPQVGVGVTMQYSGATAQMAVPGGTADVEAGGAQIGVGLRLRF